MHKPVTTLVAAGAAAVLLAGCAGSSKKDNTKGGPSSQPSVPASTSPAPDTSAISSDSSSAASSPPAGPSAPIAVNKTIVDPFFGHKVVVLKVVRNFPVPAKYPALKDSEIVLVDVTITAGAKYYAEVGSDSFLLIPDAGSRKGYTTSIAGPAMKTAGYPPLPNRGATTGKTATGWIAFTLSMKDSKSLTLRFERLAARGTDGKTVPAKNFDVVLVK